MYNIYAVNVFPFAVDPKFYVRNMYYLGMTYLKLKNKVEAKQCFEACLKYEATTKEESQVTF